jgi:2-iminobutanoate/2-iminopropanoate deaminase
MYTFNMTAPLSPFYESNGLIFISGQIGADPKTKIIPEDFESQAKNTFANIQLRLEEAGLRIESIAKTSVYLTDLSLFAKMNDMYSEFFGDHKPARTTIGVAGLPQFPGDPNVFIEIDAIASKSA